MTGTNRTYVARYPGYEDTTLILSEFHFVKSTLTGELGQNAQRGIMAEYKRAYQNQHGVVIHNWLEFDQLELKETEASIRQPTGCGCECPGCDQGHHCRKSTKGCHL